MEGDGLLQDGDRSAIFSFDRESLEALNTTKISRWEIQEARCLQGFLVSDCNGQMKFFAAHCGCR